jgi:hypothetical protein
LDSSIIFIKDSNEIYTHGREYQWVGWSYLKEIYPSGYTVFRTADDKILNGSDGPFYVKIK